MKLHMSFASCEFTDSEGETELSSFHEAVPMCHISAGLFSNIASSISLSLIGPLDEGKGRANTMMFKSQLSSASHTADHKPRTNDS